MKKCITIALNDGEDRAIRLEASKAAMTASAYVRYRLGLPQRQGRKLGKEVFSRRFAKMLKEDKKKGL